MGKLLLCALLLVPLFARAGGGLEDLTPLFRAQEYVKVQQAAERMLKSAEALPKDLVDAYRWQGLALAAQGKADEAVQSFRKLLAIEPSYQLPKGTSPKLTAPFFQAAGMARNTEGIQLRHQPPDPPQTLAGQALRVTLQSDPLGMVKSLRFQYWDESGKMDQEVMPTRGPGHENFQLPWSFSGKRVRYVFDALNEAGGILAQAGGGGHEFDLQARPQPIAHPAPLSLGPPPPVKPDEVPQPKDASGDQKETRATPWYKTWWFWTAVGVAVAGAATGTLVALLPGGGAGDKIQYEIRFK